jgi:hypothetical protein
MSGHGYRMLRASSWAKEVIWEGYDETRWTGGVKMDQIYVDDGVHFWNKDGGGARKRLLPGDWDGTSCTTSLMGKETIGYAHVLTSEAVGYFPLLAHGSVSWEVGLELGAGRPCNDSRLPWRGERDEGRGLKQQAKMLGFMK